MQASLYGAGTLIYSALSETRANQSVSENSRLMDEWMVSIPNARSLAFDLVTSSFASPAPAAGARAVFLLLADGRQVPLLRRVPRMHAFPLRRRQPQDRPSRRSRPHRPSTIRDSSGGGAKSERAGATAGSVQSRLP